MLTTTDHEKNLILDAIRATGALRVLEVGAFRGETTRVIAGAVADRGGRVVVIDPMRWSSEFFRNGIARHLGARAPRLLVALERWFDRWSYEDTFWRNVGGRDSNVSLYRTHSTDPALIANSDGALRTFDVVFIDGDHSYEGARSDLEHWGRRVRPGGVILVHDATARFPGVLRALRPWVDDPAVELVWPKKGSLCVLHVRGDLRRTERPRPIDAVDTSRSASAGL